MTCRMRCGLEIQEVLARNAQQQSYRCQNQNVKKGEHHFAEAVTEMVSEGHATDEKATKMARSNQAPN